jgi:hypothetical protein
MGKIEVYDPTKETEYLDYLSLTEAEKAGNLEHLVSTLLIEDDRLTPGVDSVGARILNFAPILQYETLQLNNLIKNILLKAEEKIGEKVEIEFAMKLPGGNTYGNYDTAEDVEVNNTYFGFLQVRPLAVSKKTVHIDKKDFDKKNLLVFPDRALGNGESDEIKDIVFIKPEDFDISRSLDIAREIEMINDVLLNQHKPFLLIGFGRWGSSDPWLGIPVNWSQISGAKTIVETTLPDLQPDFSQGSHFFHNVFSSGVFYFSVHNDQKHKIDWKWLNKQKKIVNMKYVCHIELSSPLTIKVDGSKGEGVIIK